MTEPTEDDATGGGGRTHDERGTDEITIEESDDESDRGAVDDESDRQESTDEGAGAGDANGDDGQHVDEEATEQESSDETTGDYRAADETTTDLIDRDAEYVERAIELAEESVEMGNTPFGALIVVDDEVIGEGHNETRTNDDLAAHPEMTLARWAGRELDADERARCTMYASTEPCPMCATAIHYAGLDRVVYGVAGETLNALTGDVVTIPCEEVIERAGGDTTV